MLYYYFTTLFSVYFQNYGIAREKIVLIAPPVCDEETWEKDCIANGNKTSKIFC